MLRVVRGRLDGLAALALRPSLVRSTSATEVALMSAMVRTMPSRPPVAAQSMEPVRKMSWMRASDSLRWIMVRWVPSAMRPR